MEKNTLQIKVSEELGIPQSDFTLESKLLSFPEWDSMGILAIIAMVDSEYSLQLSVDNIDKCDTVDDLLELILKL